MSRTVSRRSSSLFSALLFTLTSTCHSVDPPASAETASVRVKLAAVQSGTIRDTSEFIATLESRRSVTLQPQIDGRVSQILVQPGAEVTRGTPILQVNPDRQQAEIASTEKVLQQTLAEVSGQSVELNYYQITAPFTGTVGDIPVKVGDYVNPSTQLVTITQN